MPSRATGLLLLSVTWGALGCGVIKPADTTGGNPGGGAPGAGSTPGNLNPGDGGGQSGGGNTGAGGGSPGGGGHTGTGNSGGTNVGSGGNGTGNTSATGGATSTGSGGVRGSGGGTGNASASGGSATGGSASASGGMDGSTGGVTGSGGTTATGSGGATSSGGATASGGAPGSGGAAGSPAVDPIVALGAACDAATLIPTDVGETDMAVPTLGPNDIAVPCGTATGAVAFTFILTQPELVYADTFDFGQDTVLAFADQCDGTWTTLPAAGTTACNDDACGTSQSQAVALLGYGQHYLLVGGAHSHNGQPTIHFQHAQVGSGTVAQLDAGASTIQGTTHGPGVVSLCQASAGEDSYWWQSCPSDPGGALTASTCMGTSYDTVLSLQIPNTSTVTCADDDPTCGVQSKLGATIPSAAGIYVLTVDGTAGSDNGSYTLTTQRP